jgi:L,D-peptidoglycan transpeptidase YkuD (ErfK/YbiS/YcfS/YnhG family)
MLSSFLSLQLILVIIPHWNAVSGKLYRWERASYSDPWQEVGDPISITVGKNGMAWGLGLHEEVLDPLKKKEGDARAPAGIFALGTVFGDSQHSSYAINMPYLVVEEDLEAIDDPESRFYNQILRRSSVSAADWKSSEKMKEVGFLYALGIVVKHNENPPVPFAGSCIFIHIGSEPIEGTAGCTAMAEEDLIKLVSWLDEKKKPLLVQLPLEQYIIKKASWQLPKMLFEASEQGGLPLTAPQDL